MSSKAAGARAEAGWAPLLAVVSAPSGAGKTTLCDRFLAEHPAFVYSVSCTTRPPRGSEKDGEDYHFLSAQEFARRVDAGLFLEHALVHGHRYGTLRETVERALRAGRSVLMDIDVQGAAQIRGRLAAADEGDILKASYVDIFIAPPSLAALRERLVGRGEDSAETIARRLRNAEAEMARAGEFRHVVINDRIDEAYRRFEAAIARAARGEGR
jgi:guanylate kinase